MSRPPPAPPAAFLFDLDGTLVDSEPLHHRSTNLVLQAHGHRLGWEDYLRHIGQSEDAFLAEMKCRFALPESVPELVARRTATHAQVLADTALPLLPGMQEALDHLRASGIPLAIASAAPRPQILATLRAAAIHDLFAAIVSGHDDVARSKPAPDVYLEAARRVPADPTRCIAVEDSSHGILAARTAGCWVAAIPSPGVDPADLPPADRLLRDGRELLAVLRELLPS